MESNEQTELTGKMGTDLPVESSMTAGRAGGEGMEGLSKMGRLVDMDNSVVITGGSRLY